MIAYLNQLQDAVVVHNKAIYFIKLDSNNNIAIENFIGEIITDAKQAERIITKVINEIHALSSK